MHRIMCAPRGAREENTMPREGLVRSAIAVSAFVLAACARPSLDLNSVPARPDAAVANAMVGMWSGTVFESEADPGTPFTLVQVRHVDGTVSGQLVFSGSRSEERRVGEEGRGRSG